MHIMCFRTSTLNQFVPEVQISSDESQNHINPKKIYHIWKYNLLRFIGKGMENIAFLNPFPLLNR